METRPHWWGDFTVARRDTAYWRIGPLVLYVSHLEHEWRVYSRSDDDPRESLLEHHYPCREVIPDGLTVKRYAMHSGYDRLRLSAQLADRSVIARPDAPFYILPREEAVVYVSSPLWLRLELADTASLMDTIAIHRPSDTWFGSSVLEGHLCYAIKTYAKLRYEDVTQRPHRAMTEVTIRNASREPLLLERLHLPVPSLSLFVTANQTFCTEAVTMTRETDGEWAKVGIRKKPHDQAVSPVLVRRPERAFDNNIMLRAFNSFLT